MVSNYQKFWFELSITITIFVILFLGEWLGLMQPVTLVFERWLQPVVVKASQMVMTASQPVTLFKNSFDSARRVQELEKEYSYSLAKISELEHLQLENQELRQLLQAQEKVTPVVVAAPVISHGQPNISVGQVEGVKLGQPVLAAKMVVGLIKSISHHQSGVSLLSQNTTAPILVKTERGIEGLVVGDGKNILLTEIPKEAEVLVGDLVVTVGQEQIQSQLVIGRVRQLIDQPSAPIKEAVIEQEVSFYESSIVEVLQ
jgi:cell shape-determining protein MreC